MSLPNSDQILAFVIGLSYALLGLALILVFVRLLRGPTLTDRVMALDLIALIAVGFICVSSIAFRKPVLLDVAVAITLVSFLGTVAFAHFIEKKGKKE